MSETTFRADRSDPDRCTSQHFTMPMQCLLPVGHRENWHEAELAGLRFRYRRPGRLTEQLVNGDWQPYEAPHTAEDDRQILAGASKDSDDWDDATWAAWWRTTERVHKGGERASQARAGGEHTERLAEIREREAAATKGPWGSYRDLAGEYTVQARPWITAHGPETDGDVARIVAASDDEGYWNARFISRAREDVPFLLGLVAELTAERDRARTAAVALEQENARLTEQVERETRDRIVADLDAAIERTLPHTWAGPAMEARILGYRAAQRIAQGDAEAGDR